MLQIGTPSEHLEHPLLRSTTCLVLCCRGGGGRQQRQAPAHGTHVSDFPVSIHRSAQRRLEVRESGIHAPACVASNLSSLDASRRRGRDTGTMRSTRSIPCAPQNTRGEGTSVCECVVQTPVAVAEPGFRLLAHLFVPGRLLRERSSFAGGVAAACQPRGSAGHLCRSECHSMAAGVVFLRRHPDLLNDSPLLGPVSSAREKKRISIGTVATQLHGGDRVHSPPDEVALGRGRGRAREEKKRGPKRWVQI